MIHKLLKEASEVPINSIERQRVLRQLKTQHKRASKRAQGELLSQVEQFFGLDGHHAARALRVHLQRSLSTRRTQGDLTPRRTCNLHERGHQGLPTGKGLCTFTDKSRCLRAPWRAHPPT